MQLGEVFVGSIGSMPGKRAMKNSSLLYEALRIRMVEERIIDLYPTDLIQSPVHLSIGQEAVAVGVCANLNKDDWVFINYRGHAFYLAKGGPLPEFFAELMGREGGLSKGKAGSMHLAAPEFGVMGASAVVASTISHAAGAALAEKIKGVNDRIFVSNFGDGATEQGVLHETLNFASLHHLPVLFLCENNGLAVHSSMEERQSYNKSQLLKAYNIAYVCCEDGHDPVAVAKVAKEVIAEVRSLGKPVFLEIKTARYMEHVGPGEDFDAGYRSKEFIDAWKRNDPLNQKNEDLETFKLEIAKEIDAAVEFALGSKHPGVQELLTDVI